MEKQNEGVAGWAKNSQAIHPPREDATGETNKFNMYANETRNKTLKRTSTKATHNTTYKVTHKKQRNSKHICLKCLLCCFFFLTKENKAHFVQATVFLVAFFTIAKKTFLLLEKNALSKLKAKIRHFLKTGSDFFWILTSQRGAKCAGGCRATWAELTR